MKRYSLYVEVERSGRCIEKRRLDTDDLARALRYASRLTRVSGARWVCVVSGGLSRAAQVVVSWDPGERGWCINGRS